MPFSGFASGYGTATTVGFLADSSHISDRTALLPLSHLILIRIVPLLVSSEGNLTDDWPGICFLLL